MKIFTLANLLSLFRIVVAPLFMFMMLSENPTLIMWASWLFLIGALTDYFDGVVARMFKSESKFGRFVDPLADKFLTTAAFVVFVIMDIIPLWMVIIIIIRDFGITFMRIYGHSIKKPIKTSYFAKVKTFLQMSFIAYVLTLSFFEHLNLSVFDASLAKSYIYSDFTFVSMLIVTFITVITLVEYIYKSYFFQTKQRNNL